MNKLSIRKRFNQVAPSMDENGNSSFAGVKVLTPEVLKTKYGLTQDSLLDVCTLPLASSPEFQQLSNLTSFKACFMTTADKCLTTLDEKVKEMLVNASDPLLPFLPEEIVPNSADKGISMTEMESLFFLILESIRLVDEPIAKDQANFIRNCVNSLSELTKGIQTLETHVDTHRKELKNHCRRVRNLYTVCKTDYPQGVPHAAELYSDFYINTGSDPSILRTGIQRQIIPPSFKMKFRCQPNGFAVFTRFPETTPNWKDGITFNAQTRNTMREGINSEFHERVEFATTSLKTCLSKILRASQSAVEVERTGFKMEIDKLNRLFEFRRLGIKMSEMTALIFLFIRLEQSLEDLNTLLYNLAQALICLRTRLKYVSKNCASWPLLQKKIIYGPMSYNAERLKYLKLEIPLTTTWTDDCVQDFLFENEPVAIPVESPARNVLSMEGIGHLGEVSPESYGHGIFPMDKKDPITLQPEKILVVFGGGGDLQPGEDEETTDLESENLQYTLSRMNLDQEA